MTKQKFSRLKKNCPLLFVFVAQYQTVLTMHAEHYQLWREKQRAANEISDQLTQLENLQENLEQEFKKDFGCKLPEVVAFLAQPK